MTDLELTRLCAEAMGIPLYYPFGKDVPHFRWTGPWHERDTSDDGGALRHYYPLHDDAQAMALLKRFSLYMPLSILNSPDINRAICECVARMQAVK